MASRALLPVSTALLATLAASALVACGDVADPTKERVAALESRLADIDRRLSGVETGLPDVKALRDQLAAIDTRLSGIEGRVTRLQEAAQAAPPSSPSASATGGAAARAGQPDVDQRQRAQAMSALGAEYRRKLAELNAMRGDESVDPRERAAQRRELSRWFRDQRRALLTGQTPPPAE
jgi:hypothetical protein